MLIISTINKQIPLHALSVRVKGGKIEVQFYI